MPNGSKWSQVNERALADFATEKFRLTSAQAGPRFSFEGHCLLFSMIIFPTGFIPMQFARSPGLRISHRGNHIFLRAPIELWAWLSERQPKTDQSCLFQENKRRWLDLAGSSFLCTGRFWEPRWVKTGEKSFLYGRCEVFAQRLRTTVSPPGSSVSLSSSGCAFLFLQI